MENGFFSCSLDCTYIHALQGMIHEELFTFLFVYLLLKSTKEPALHTQSSTITSEQSCLVGLNRRFVNQYSASWCQILPSQSIKCQHQVLHGIRAIGIPKPNIVYVARMTQSARTPQNTADQTYQISYVAMTLEFLSGVATQFILGRRAGYFFNTAS